MHFCIKKEVLKKCRLCLFSVRARYALVKAFSIRNYPKYTHMQNEIFIFDFWKLILLKSSIKLTKSTLSNANITYIHETLKKLDTRAKFLHKVRQMRRSKLSWFVTVLYAHCYKILVCSFREFLLSEILLKFIKSFHKAIVIYQALKFKALVVTHLSYMKSWRWSVRGPLLGQQIFYSN